MSKVRVLRALVKQRLTAAAEDIFGLFERTIAEYEETLCRSQEENERQRRLLDAVFNPQLRLHRAGIQQLLVSKEEVPPEQQEWSSSLDQEDPPEPPHIKEEQEEVWANQEGEQLHGLQEAKEEEEEDEEEPQPSQLHQRERPFSCPFCGKTFVQMVYLLSHLKYHTGEKPYSCPCCNKCFSQPDRLQSHMRTHTGEKPFSCSVCDKRFTWSCQLKNHLCGGGESSQLHELCTNQEGEQLQGQEEAEITKFTLTSVPVKSEDDGEEKPQSSQLLQRQTEQMETEADGEDCGGPEPARNSDPDTHLKPVSEDSDDDLKESREPQSGLNFVTNKGCTSFGKGLICSECGKQFCSSTNLKVHVRIHTGEKPFSCPVCGKGFIQKAHLQNHLKCHTGEKPNSCSLCNAFFSRPDILMSHMRTHTGETPFSCNVCDKSFTWSHLVKRHKCGSESTRRTEQDCRGPEPARNSHPDPYIQPDTNYKTEEPSESETDVSDGDWKETREPQSGLNFQKNNEVFVSQMTAEKQLLLHSCSECGKKFGNKPNLKVHMRIHTGEKPFSCLVCGKIFEQGEDLRQHMAVHSGRRKLRCTLCDKRFTWYRQFKEHKCVCLQSSQLHQADGEDGGGPEPARNSHPETHLTPDTDDMTEDSSEPETENIDSGQRETKELRVRFKKVIMKKKIKSQ